MRQGMKSSSQPPSQQVLKRNALVAQRMKQRLLELEKEYAEKIRTLKSAQARKAIRKELREYHKRKVSQGQMKVADLVQGDKINLEIKTEDGAASVTEEDQEEVKVVVAKRRRSLVDMSSSCKPQLVDLKAADDVVDRTVGSTQLKQLSETHVNSEKPIKGRNTTVTDSGSDLPKITVEITNEGAIKDKPDIKLPPAAKLEKLINSQVRQIF